MNESMIDCRAWVSLLFHECQMVIELPGGGADTGGLGGSSVGDGPGVPGRGVKVGYWVGCGEVVPVTVTEGVTDFAGATVGCTVLVAGRGYGCEVLVLSGGGYCDSCVGFSGGPGYWATVVSVGEGIVGNGVAVTASNVALTVADGVDDGVGEGAVDDGMAVTACNVASLVADGAGDGGGVGDSDTGVMVTNWIVGGG